MIPIGDRVKIYRRGKKGTWTASYWFDGDHRRISLKTTNQKVANRRATDLAAQLNDGTHRPIPKGMTIVNAIERYLTFLQTERRARKTIVRYRGELETFRDFCNGRRIWNLGQIKLSVFDDFRRFRLESVSERTLYHEGIVCKQFLKWCMSRQLLASNPLHDLKLTKPARTDKSVLSFENVANVLGRCSGQRRAMLAVLAFSGMRSGELSHLRAEDVDLEGRWFHVVSREGFETKTRQSRKIPIHPALLPLLAEYRPAQGEWFFSAGLSERYPAGGQPINTKKLNERFQVTMRKVKLPTGRAAGGFTLHSLRHFFETYCINSGIPQRVVDTWLGHRSDRSMASVYYHLSDKESQRFMGSLPFELPA